MVDVPWAPGRALTPHEYHEHLLRPLGPVVHSMERTGLVLDRAAALEIRDRAERDSIATQEQLDAWVGETLDVTGVNWNSVPQLKDILHNRLGLPESPYWKKGKVKQGEVKLDDKALDWLAGYSDEHRTALHALRRLRREVRVAGFADKMVELAVAHSDGTWTLHPTFGLSHDGDSRPGARTGRFGVKNPPFQQVKRTGKGDPYPLRKAIVAPPGFVVVVADYSQLEVVELGHICVRLGLGSGLAAKLERGQPDLHSITAIEVWSRLGIDGIADCPPDRIKGHPEWGWYRETVKAIRYGLNYGKGDYGFGYTLFYPDGRPLGEDDAGRLRAALFAADPEVEAYQAYIREFVAEHLGIPSLLGRWSPLPGAARHHPDWVQHRAQRQAYNYPMQAGGQEVVVLAMIRAHSDPVLRSLGFLLVMQVHDELIGYCPAENGDKVCARLREIMETSFPLAADLQAEPHLGPSWQEAKK